MCDPWLCETWQNQVCNQQFSLSLCALVIVCVAKCVQHIAFTTHTAARPIEIDWVNDRIVESRVNRINFSRCSVFCLWCESEIMKSIFRSGCHEKLTRKCMCSIDFFTPAALPCSKGSTSFAPTLRLSNQHRAKICFSHSPRRRRWWGRSIFNRKKIENFFFALVFVDIFYSEPFSHIAKILRRKTRALRLHCNNNKLIMS